MDRCMYACKCVRIRSNFHPCMFVCKVIAQKITTFYWILLKWFLIAECGENKLLSSILADHMPYYTPMWPGRFPCKKCDESGACSRWVARKHWTIPTLQPIFFTELFSFPWICTAEVNKPFFIRSRKKTLLFTYIWHTHIDLNLWIYCPKSTQQNGNSHFYTQSFFICPKQSKIQCFY